MPNQSSMDEDRKEESTKEGRERETHLGLCKIPNAPIHPALQKVHLREDHLVVQPLQLGEERVDERERGAVLRCVEVQPHQTCLQRVLEEDALLGLCPGDVIGEGLFEDVPAVGY